MVGLPRRASKQRIFRKPKKKSQHSSLCDDFYNRLQAKLCDKDLEALLERFWRAASFTGPYPGYCLFTEHIITLASTRIETLQMNYPSHVSYRCVMSYTDRGVKPVYGYLYPTMCVVKTSPRLVYAATLAYIELSKRLGKFP